MRWGLRNPSSNLCQYCWVECLILPSKLVFRSLLRTYFYTTLSLKEGCYGYYFCIEAIFLNIVFSSLGRMEANRRVVMKTTNTTLSSTAMEETVVCGIVTIKAKDTAPLVKPAPQRIIVSIPFIRHLSDPTTKYPNSVGRKVLANRAIIKANKVHPNSVRENASLEVPSCCEVNACTLNTNTPINRNMTPEHASLSDSMEALVANFPSSLRLYVLKWDSIVPLISIDTTPEQDTASLAKYDKYPVSRVKATYDTAFLAKRKRQCRNRRVVVRPKAQPMSKEQVTTYRNCRSKYTMSLAARSMLFCCIGTTVLRMESKSVTAMVSLKRHSPKKIENSFGYFSLFTTFSETIGSMLVKATAVINISQFFKEKHSCESETEVKRLRELSEYRRRYKRTMLMALPTMPYKLMYAMLCRNFLRGKLYPSSNMIGGSRTRKIILRIVLSFNCQLVQK